MREAGKVEMADDPLQAPRTCPKCGSTRTTWWINHKGACKCGDCGYEWIACVECGVQTGGAEFCYQHAPYMVYPKADGSFLSDRGGRKRIWFDEPPSRESEASANELDAALRSLPVETDVQALDASRWQMVEQALTDPALPTETSRLIAIGSIVTSRKPYTEQDIARTRKLAEQHGWETP